MQSFGGTKELEIHFGVVTRRQSMAKATIQQGPSTGLIILQLRREWLKLENGPLAMLMSSEEEEKKEVWDC